MNTFINTFPYTETFPFGKQGSGDGVGSIRASFLPHSILGCPCTWPQSHGMRFCPYTHNLIQVTVIQGKLSLASTMLSHRPIWPCLPLKHFRVPLSGTEHMTRNRYYSCSRSWGDRHTDASWEHESAIHTAFHKWSVEHLLHAGYCSGCWAHISIQTCTKEYGIYTGYRKNTEETPLILSRRINEGFFEKRRPWKEPWKIKWGRQSKASPTGRRAEAPGSGHTGGHHCPAGLGRKGRQGLPSPALGSKTRCPGPRAPLCRALSPGETWSNSHLRQNFLNWLLFTSSASPASGASKCDQPDSFSKWIWRSFKEEGI